MASTSYLARVIFREHTGDVGSEIDFSGTYNLLVKAKSIPSPASAPNTVESTTLEDDTQTFEMGIKTTKYIVNTILYIMQRKKLHKIYTI